jgi:Methylamine utilisation protein MauE
VAAAARVVLALAFAYSAVAKAWSWRTLPDAMRAFGIPSSLARVVAFALPAVELAVALLLIVAWSSAWPAWLAIGLLAGFTVLLVRASITHTPCPCFGAAHEAPAGAMSVVRNGVLLALAVLATAT